MPGFLVARLVGPWPTRRLAPAPDGATAKNLADKALFGELLGLAKSGRDRP
jgi:hypothetical protein